MIFDCDGVAGDKWPVESIYSLQTRCSVGAQKDAANPYLPHHDFFRRRARQELRHGKSVLRFW
jgi:hypothetical protein